jgi:hypothetical protein
MDILGFARDAVLGSVTCNVLFAKSVYHNFFKWLDHAPSTPVKNCRRISIFERSLTPIQTVVFLPRDENKIAVG